MPGVFISYRRQDSAGHTGRLFDRLQAGLGRGRVFMDIAGIDPGVDFVQTIERAVGSCDVLLAVIGPEWLTCTGVSGHSRLDDHADFVRTEISAALRRGVRVIPVLIAGASMPPAQALPEDLVALGRLQMVELRDTRWHADTSDLIATLQGLLGANPEVQEVGRKRKVVSLLTGVLAATLVTAFPTVWYLWFADRPTAPATASTPGASERLLNYSLTVRRNPQQHPAKALVQVAGNRTISAGDLVRFSISSPQPGFLYVINEGPPDKQRRTPFTVLFPSARSNNGSAKLTAGQEVRIPEQDDGIELDGGVAKLWLVWSVTEINEHALEGRANRNDQGEIKDARDIDALRNFLTSHMSPAPDVQHDGGATRTTLKAPGDILVHLVTFNIAARIRATRDPNSVARVTPGPAEKTDPTSQATDHFASAPGQETTPAVGSATRSSQEPEVAIAKAPLSAELGGLQLRKDVIVPNLDALRQRQRNRGFELRSDMSAAELRMTRSLSAAAAEIGRANMDLETVMLSLRAAQDDIETLEDFLDIR
jgi:hypothetical protein